MTNLTTLTTTQLRTIVAIKEQIETLQTQLDSIAGGEEGETPTPLTEDLMVCSCSDPLQTQQPHLHTLGEQHVAHDRQPQQRPVETRQH